MVLACPPLGGSGVRKCGCRPIAPATGNAGPVSRYPGMLVQVREPPTGTSRDAMDGQGLADRARRTRRGRLRRIDRTWPPDERPRGR